MRNLWFVVLLNIVILSLGLWILWIFFSKRDISYYVAFPELTYLKVSPDRRFAVFRVDYPDGNFKLKASKIGKPPGIYLLDLTTRHLRLLIPESKDSSCFAPSFTFDGKEILVVRYDRKIQCATIWQFDLNSLRGKPITPRVRPRWESCPLQSPDGRFIVYCVKFEGRGSIDDFNGDFVEDIPLDGGCDSYPPSVPVPDTRPRRKWFLFDTKTRSCRLLKLPSLARVVRWLPDGKLICTSGSWWHICEEDCSTKNFLWIVDPATGETVAEHRLGMCHITIPEISPDGRYILTTLHRLHFPPMGLWVIDLHEWTTKLQILSREIKEIQIPMNRLTSIPGQMISELESVLGIRDLAQLKEHIEQIKGISWDDDLRGLIAKYSQTRFTEPVTLRSLREEGGLLLLQGRLTKELFIRLIQDADFIKPLKEEFGEKEFEFRWWAWVDENTILCVAEDLTCLPAYTGYNEFKRELVSRCPEDIWLIDIRTGKRKRLTNFGKLEIKIAK
jgi:hypothetical protein